jgi:hypothetical protein
MSGFSAIRRGLRGSRNAKLSTQQLPAAVIVASSADQATFYVTASGNDGNTGLHWGQGFATIQKAINSLPVNGGIVEVGYGTFAGFTLDANVQTNRQSVLIRGRGIGHSTSVTDSTVASPGIHPTRINSPCIINAQQAGGVPENKWMPTRLEDFAVTGVTSGLAITGTLSSGSNHITAISPNTTGIRIGDFITGNANLPLDATVQTIDSSTQITISQNCSGNASGAALTANHSALQIDGPNVLLRRLAVDSNNGHGITQIGPNSIAGDSFFLRIDDVRCLKNGASGYYGQPLTLEASNSNFDGNGLDGMACGVFGQDAGPVTMVDCTFQRNQNYGANLICTPFTAVGCQWEGNSLNNINGKSVNAPSSGPYVFLGCIFVGDTTEFYAFTVSVATYVIGCYFVGHQNGNAIGYPFSGVPLVCLGNLCADTSLVLINGGIGPGTQTISGAQAASPITLGVSSIKSAPLAQTLAANGAVTINAQQGDAQRVLLQANMTSSTISNPQPGQQMTLEVVQDAVGGRTYVLPTNIRFAGNSEGAHTSTANRKDSYTLVYDWIAGLWTEISRALNVPVT